MRNKMFVIFILPLLAILFFSGCTTPTGTGKGVTVLAFEPDHTEIYSSEPITFRLRMRNDGYVEATKAHAELLGLDEDWCGSQSTYKCTPSQGDRPEMLPKEPECQYTEGGGFNLLPVDRQAGTQGGEQTCTWTYNAPSLTSGFEITYTPIARVFYSYKSAVTKLITFASSDEIRRIRDSGGSLPAETIGDTESPIQLRIETKGPIRFWEDKYVIFPLEITITDVGNGGPCAKDTEDTKNACKATKSGEEAKDKVRIKVTLADENMIFLDSECSDMASGKTISLWQGKNSFVCDIQASKLDLTAPVQENIKAEAFYEYFYDTTSSIKVIGRRTQ